MELTDLLRAIRAEEKGEYNVALNLIKNLHRPSIGNEIAPISQEIAKTGIMRNITKSAKKTVASLLVATSLFAGGMAEAKNYVPVGKSVDVLAQNRQLKYLTDYVSGLYTKDLPQKIRARRLLYRTAIHESESLQHRRQTQWVGPKGHRVEVETSIARSIFGVEPDTAKKLVTWSLDHPKAMDLLTKTSGLSKAQLISKSNDDIADLLMTNEKFAAATARVKYLSVKGAIPDDLSSQAGYAAKKYFVGKKDNRAALQAKYKKQFIEDNVNFSRKVNAAMMNQQKNLSKVGAGSMTSKKAAKFLKKIIPR